MIIVDIILKLMIEIAAENCNCISESNEIELPLLSIRGLLDFIFMSPSKSSILVAIGDDVDIRETLVVDDRARGGRIFSASSTLFSSA